MKMFWYSARLLLFIFFIATAVLAVLEFTGPSSLLSGFNFPPTKYKNNESFDPSLARLDNMTKLEAYCDSIYAEKKKIETDIIFENTYPQVVSEVVRNRFYHGMSSYGFGDNYLGYIINSCFPGMLLNAPVITDDILKHPYAICSQQAMVAMKLLEQKDFLTRKVGFNSSAIAGHFCYETFFQGQWHFYDTDMEPDAGVLLGYGRPGIKFLTDNPDIIKKAYSKLDPDKVVAIFGSFFYGKPKERLAPNATLFQELTKYLSYTIWIFFLLAFIWARRKYLKITSQQYVRNRRVSIPNVRQGRPAEDYQVYGPSGA